MVETLKAERKKRRRRASPKGQRIARLAERGKESDLEGSVGHRVRRGASFSMPQVGNRICRRGKRKPLASVYTQRATLFSGRRPPFRALSFQDERTVASGRRPTLTYLLTRASICHGWDKAAREIRFRANRSNEQRLFKLKQIRIAEKPVGAYSKDFSLALFASSDRAHAKRT